MLSENVYVNEGGINLSEVYKGPWAFIFKCENCNKQYVITSDNVEDFIYSDPHDPLYDYFMCKNCNKSLLMMNGVEGKCNSIPSKLWSDNTFVYLNKMGRDYRIL